MQVKKKVQNNELKNYTTEGKFGAKKGGQNGWKLCTGKKMEGKD